jgi:hypothetical protein
MSLYLYLHTEVEQSRWALFAEQLKLKRTIIAKKKT